MNDERKNMETIRLARRLLARPEEVVPPRRAERLGLSDEDVEKMRTGQWSPPNPVADAIEAALAPIRDAAAASKDALEAFVVDPGGSDTDTAVQAVARVALALANIPPAPEPDPIGSLFINNP